MTQDILPHNRQLVSGSCLVPKHPHTGFFRWPFFGRDLVTVFVADFVVVWDEKGDAAVDELSDGAMLVVDDDCADNFACSVSVEGDGTAARGGLFRCAGGGTRDFCCFWFRDLLLLLLEFFWLTERDDDFCESGWRWAGGFVLLSSPFLWSSSSPSPLWLSFSPRLYRPKSSTKDFNLSDSELNPNNCCKYSLTSCVIFVIQNLLGERV